MTKYEPPAPGHRRPHLSCHASLHPRFRGGQAARQFLLRPERHVNDAFLYCLAVAAERYGIPVHGWICMSSHIHYVVRDNRGNLPAFLAFFHGMLARLVNSLRGRWENMWSTEPTCAVCLVEAADRFDKLLYLLTNAIKDHLVEHVSDWPGACSFIQHLTGLPKILRRPRRFFREEGPLPEEVVLRAEKPEGFEHLSDEAWSAMIAGAVEQAETAARAERAETGRRILGRKAILRAAPTDSSSTVEPRGNLRPHIACKSEPVRIAALAAPIAFRHAYREARQAWLAGDHAVLFPLGTYAFTLLGARSVPPPPD